jgi:hypothetical protein
VRDGFKVKHLDVKYQIPFHLNPFYLISDFHGDGLLDVAILIKEKSTGKIGIAISTSNKKDFFILGAGHSLNRARDFD